MYLARSLSLTAYLYASSIAAAAVSLTNTTTSNITVTKAPVHVPITVTSVNVINLTSDDEFNPAIYRDGGGGGLINGYHIMAFADSFTTSSPGIVNNSYTSFVHNSFAYLGYRNKSNPSDLFDFGSDVHPDGTRTFLQNGLVAQGNETNTPDTNIAIWPDSNMVPLIGTTTAVAVYSVFNITADEVIYNTMALMDVLDPETAILAPGNTLSVQRLVPRLFYASENMYGSFATYKYSGLQGEPSDANLYLFSTSSNGIKVARVNGADKEWRHYYYYWTGKTWSLTQPSITATSANLMSWSYVNIYDQSTHGPGSGDVFWSVYFQTFVCVFQGDGIDSAFYISYSTTQQITGPWTVPAWLYNPPTSELCEEFSPDWEFNYAGHAYPSWDATGKTLLLSWSSCNAWTTMATVNFG